MHWACSPICVHVAGSGEEESPYSEAAQALLTQPDGTIPESILKLEPATVNTVCNDIIETSSAIQWDDIAGVQHLFFISIIPQRCSLLVQQQ